MEPPERSCINSRLLPMKAHYFFFNAGTGAITPYLATYGRQLGLSSILVGYVLSLSPLSAMATKLIFGGISDRYMKLRFLFLLFQVISTFALLGIHFIPEVPMEAELHCSAVSNFKICKPNLGNDDNIFPNNTDTVRCKFTCEFDPQQWEDQLCHKWQPPIVPCPFGARTSFPFYANISLNHSDVEKDCAYLRATHLMPFSSPKSPPSDEFVPFCNSSKGLLKAKCGAECDHPALMEVLQPIAATSASTSQFIWFLLLTLIAWASMENVASLGDTICFGVLGAHGNKYGEQRVWGSIGWGASTFITGALIDEVSGEGKKDYSVAFYVMLSNVALSIIVSYFIKYTQTKMSRSILWDVRKVLVDVRVTMFIICCVVMGMCTGLLWTFLFWHLEVLGDKMGSERQRIKLLQGLTAAVQCLLGELPLFFLSGRIIKKIGHVHSLTVVLLVMAVRLLLYAVLVDPWWVLPIELLQGFTFGLFYATMVSYGSMVAPPGTETTMQALVGAAFGGIGVALGSMISGWLYAAAGGSLTFGLFSAGSLLCCFAHLAVQFSNKQAQYSTDSDGSKQSASYASPSDAVFITDNTDVM